MPNNKKGTLFIIFGIICIVISTVSYVCYSAEGESFNELVIAEKIIMTNSFPQSTILETNSSYFPYIYLMDGQLQTKTIIAHFFNTTLYLSLKIMEHKNIFLNHHFWMSEERTNSPYRLSSFSIEL